MARPGHADLVVTGRIATLDGRDGPGWIEALAIAGGRVLAAGSRAEIHGLASAGSRTIRLLADEVALPGLTDAHLHLAEAAMARVRVDLRNATSIEELRARVRVAASAAPGDDAWIEGSGWDPDRLGGWPTAADLERAAPGLRIALWAHDHHALLVSDRALAEAGIDGRGDSDGGLIRRDTEGRATGVLHESATRLVTDRLPPPSVSTLETAVAALVRDLLALGIVAVHDPGGLTAGSGLGAPIEAYRRLAADGALGLRLHASIRVEQLAAAGAQGLRSGGSIGPDPRDRLRLGWLKTFADGTLGSRTAALIDQLERIDGEPPAPYDGFGVWLTPPDELRRLAAAAARIGIATQVHAIGDAAVRAALDALEPTAGATPLMPRIEHVQLVADADIGRFAARGIAASVQPIHLRSDAAGARRLWGSRAETRGYPLGSLARSGAVMPFGTDAPVEPEDPWPGIACAVTRSAASWEPGTAPFGPGNAVTLWRAIRAACVDPAVSAGETDRGRLVAGHRADLVVLAAGAVEAPVEVDGALWHARPRLVLLDGEVAAGDR
jgi:predicted amidohydrolase YtcJ